MSIAGLESDEHGDWHQAYLNPGQTTNGYFEGPGGAILRPDQVVQNPGNAGWTPSSSSSSESGAAWSPSAGATDTYYGSPSVSAGLKNLSRNQGLPKHNPEATRGRPDIVVPQQGMGPWQKFMVATVAAVVLAGAVGHEEHPTWSMNRWLSKGLDNTLTLVSDAATYMQGPDNAVSKAIHGKPDHPRGLVLQGTRVVSINHPHAPADHPHPRIHHDGAKPSAGTAPTVPDESIRQTPRVAPYTYTATP